MKRGSFSLLIGLSLAYPHPTSAVMNQFGQDARFVSQSVPAVMEIGQRYTVSVTMQNTGFTSWRRNRDYALASSNPPDNILWGLNRVRVEGNTQFLGVHTFTFSVTPPSVPGVYNFQWQMVGEAEGGGGGDDDDDDDDNGNGGGGIVRFGDLTGNVFISVVQPPIVLPPTPTPTPIVLPPTPTPEPTPTPVPPQEPPPGGPPVQQPPLGGEPPPQQPPPSGVISDVAFLPNPFNPNTGPMKLRYQLDANSDVKIAIYEVFGNVVKELSIAQGQDGGRQGENFVMWDGRNGSGETVANGVYIFRVTGTDQSGRTFAVKDRAAVAK